MVDGGREKAIESLCGCLGWKSIAFPTQKRRGGPHFLDGELSMKAIVIMKAGRRGGVTLGAAQTRSRVIDP